MLVQLTLLTAIVTFFTCSLAQKCYGLNGTRLDESFAPCNPTAKHSGCCATKRSIGADVCLDNGLCMSTRDESIGMIWQNACTDPSGKDAACPRICPDVTTNFGGMNPVPAWNVQQCDLGKYCCRAANDRQSCCNNATAPKVTMSSVVALLAQPPTSSIPISSTTTSSAPTSWTPIADTEVSTNTPFKATTIPDHDSCKKEKRQTTIVGATIGLIFGAIIVGLCGALFWLHKKEQHQREMKEHYQDQIAQSASYRKNIADSAVSLMAAVPFQEVKTRSMKP